MGSGQSTGSRTGHEGPAVKMSADPSSSEAKRPAGVTDPTEASLSGMQLVNYKCRKRKKLYDKCVKNWYCKEFLPGKSMSQEEACAELFENYRTCVLKGIKKEIWDKKGLPAPKEGSMLDEISDE